MPHAAFKLLPGVDQNKTPALNEAAISFSQLIRFIPDRTLGGLVQKLGGWTKYVSTNIGSIPRSIWAWEDTNANSYLAVGSDGIAPVSVSNASGDGTTVTLTYSPTYTFTPGNSIIVSGISPAAYNGTYIVTASSGTTVQYASTTTTAYVSGGLITGGGKSLQVINSGTTNDITPQITQVNIAVDIDTVAGSAEVTVNDTGRNADNYDVVDFQTRVSVGGLVLFGQYQCIALGANTYKIVARDIFGDPQPAAFTTISSPATVTGASGTGTTATITHGSAYVFPLGSAITVSGITPAGYNGTYIVTASAAGTVSFASKVNLPYSSGGTISNTGATPKYETTVGSDFVTVILADHGFSAGATYSILVATQCSGITLYGNYTVLEVIDSNSFIISGSTTASALAVTGGTGTGTVVTLSYSGSGTYVPAENITVAGVTPAAWDGTYAARNPVPGQVSFLNATAGTWTSGGTISGPMYAMENGGQARLLYYNGIGPLVAGTGYGVGPYGAGAYGSGIPPVLGTGVPINAVDWTLDNWGELLVANPLNGPIFTWSPTSGDPVALIIPNAPPVNEGMFVAMPQRQIIAWGSTFTGVKDPLLIRWCDVNNYDSWIALITNQAGSYRIPKGSRIVQCIQGPQQGLIWTDLGVWAMQYVGPPYVYQFNEIGTGCGLIGRKAAGSMNGVVYWMGQSQFFRMSGGGPEPIRCPIWDVVFQDLDTSNLDKIRFAANSRFGEITWYFPTVSNGGENEGYVKYNILLNEWDYGFNSTQNPYVSRSAWINESVLGPPMGGATDGFIYQHETSTDADGSPMFSSFQTGYFVITEADLKMFIDQVWPDMKWGYFGGTQGANVLLTFYVTDYPGQTPLVYGPYTLTQATTYITPRFRGRLVSIKIESNDTGSFWRLGNIRYRVQQDGKF